MYVICSRATAISLGLCAVAEIFSCFATTALSSSELSFIEKIHTTVSPCILQLCIVRIWISAVLNNNPDLHSVLFCSIQGLTVAVFNSDARSLHYFET